LQTPLKNHAWPACCKADLGQVADQIKEIIACKRDALIFLNGEMGVGKSTLAKVIIQQFSSFSQFSGSPSFPILNVYAGSIGPIYHLDLYRVQDVQELQDAGIISQLYDESGLTIIEWSERFPDLRERMIRHLPVSSVLDIQMQMTNKPDQRQITIQVLS
jgi:tRNA threonylcarbamoyladenosine biosynthesis protein TsaE